MTVSPVKLHVVVSQPFAENTYIAHLQSSTDCIVFDPGLEPELIFELLDANSLVPAAILNTHGHADHIGGNRAMKQRWPKAPLVIGRGDAPKLTDPEANLSGPFGIPITSPPADLLVDEGDIYSAAGLDFEVLETPGHSSGHVVFVLKASQPWIVFGGDVLFQGSVGRSDFPDGDARALLRSIREKLFTLPDDTLVLPGHGPTTTIGAEKRTNPFCAVDLD